MGIKRVKEKGGIVFAQDPAEAEYQEMPRNSIATGLVDFILPVAESRQDRRFKAHRVRQPSRSATTETAGRGPGKSVIRDLYPAAHADRARFFKL